MAESRLPGCIFSYHFYIWSTSSTLPCERLLIVEFTGFFFLISTVTWWNKVSITEIHELWKPVPLKWFLEIISDTHINNQEVQPAPGIGEIGLKPIGHPFEKHLQDKDVSEDFVSILQHCLDRLSLLNVYIFKGLWIKKTLFTLMTCLPKML